MLIYATENNMKNVGITENRAMSPACFNFCQLFRVADVLCNTILLQESVILLVIRSKSISGLFVRDEPLTIFISSLYYLNTCSRRLLEYLTQVL